MDCNKTMRLLVMHDMLTRGEGINKAETAARFGVNERSIQRDIEELTSMPRRNFFLLPFILVSFSKKVSGTARVS